jgi:hypothetical protein
MLKPKIEGRSHVQNAMRAGWYWHIYCTEVCWATGVISNPRGICGIEGKIMLPNIQTEWIMSCVEVLKMGFLHSFKTKTILRIL